MNGEAVLIFLITEIVLIRKQYYKVKYREILEKTENMIHAGKKEMVQKHRSLKQSAVET